MAPNSVVVGLLAWSFVLLSNGVTAQFNTTNTTTTSLLTSGSSFSSTVQVTTNSTSSIPIVSTTAQSTSSTPSVLSTAQSTSNSSSSISIVSSTAQSTLNGSSASLTSISSTSTTLPVAGPTTLSNNGTTLLPSTSATQAATSNGTSVLSTTTLSSSTSSSVSTSLSSTGNGTVSTTSASVSSILSSSSTISSSLTVANGTSNSTALPVPVQTTVVGGVTQTLVTTVATDSAGSTYTGTITEAPTSTSAAISDLTTYSTFPPSVSWSSTSAQSNSHDSSGHPILGSWPGCWFCPPGSGGIVLFNWPGPGVYPGGGPPAGFPTPFPPITIAPDGDPSYESSPEPTQPSTSASSASSSESCSTTETATEVTYYVSYVTDTAGSTLSTSTWSTASSQITGCTVTGTVATSTTATGSSYPWCEASSCAGCNARRDAPTAANAPPTGLNLQSYSENVFNVVRNITKRESEDLAILERDIPEYYSGIPELYSTVGSLSNTIEVPLDTGPVSGSVIQEGISSSRFTAFDNAEHNILVQYLQGCTSVVVVSRLGAYATHFWEAPYFRDTGSNDRFQQVIDYMNDGRAGGEPGTQVLAQLVSGGTFGDTATYNTQIFIMTPATKNLDLETDVPASYTKGNNPALYGTGDGTIVDRLDPLKTYLNGLMPGVPISTFVYQRQKNDGLTGGVYGKATILYSNSQEYNPDDRDAEDPPLAAPQKAVWQCWMQGTKMGSDLWDALSSQTCGSSTGNSKRQDGSACSLSASASTTGSASSASTSAASSTDVGSIILSGLGSSNTSLVVASTSSSSSITSIASNSATTTSITSATQTLASNTTSTVSATQPPITSCALATASAFTLDGVSYTASQYCSCNDDTIAGLNTLTMSDGSSELYCALGSSTTIVVSTEAPSTTQPPITSCALATASAFTLDGVSYTASQYCSCNDDTDAGLNTLTMSDGSSELYCALGSSTTIVVSTEVPSTTAPPSTTTAPPATSTTSSTPPPSSAAPNQIILFSDLNCQDYIDTNDYDHFSSACWQYYDAKINSYIVGTTSGCSCSSSDHSCTWDTFVITTSDACGYDDEVGGGCSGAGGQTPTKCNPTTGPASYITAETTTNGICKREAGNGTATDERSLELRGFELEARAAGRINPRC